MSNILQDSMAGKLLLITLSDKKIPTPIENIRKLKNCEHFGGTSTFETKIEQRNIDKIQKQAQFTSNTVEKRFPYAIYMGTKN